MDAPLASANGRCHNPPSSAHHRRPTIVGMGPRARGYKVKAMSKRSYFGTDGIRGQANQYPMTAEVALRVGLAAGKLFRSADDQRHLVVIGKDTRLSGYMIEPALVAGFTSVG